MRSGLATVTVVPCFNEARRLRPDALLELVAEPGAGLLLVDDGSTDDTAARLGALAARRPEAVEVLRLPENRGKAEAVRAGLLRALALGAPVVGYFDADLATPPAEMRRLLALVARGPAQVALASRVALLGTRIERRPLRHYLGRVFATAASLALAMRVYDTQCGAKALRAGPALASALEAPFTSRWVFDVELLSRLLSGEGPRLTPADFVEMPLRQWEDVAGSKLSARAMAGAALDLARLARRHRGR